jgi:Tol biopolymer transport system component
MDADGTNVRLLTDQSRIAHGDWAPDGTSVVFANNGAAFLTIMQYPDGPSRQVFAPSGAVWADVPRWSPDGVSIAFQAWANDRPDLYVADVADWASRQVTRSRSYDEYPTWSADGRQLAFHSDRDPAFWLPEVAAEDIYIVDADGDNVQNVTQSKQRELWPSWSPDGRQIAFTRTWGPLSKTELWILDLDTSRERQITGIPPLWTATWTPSGQRLLLTVFQDIPDRTDIAIVDADGSNFRRLMDTPDVESHPRMFDPAALSVSPASKATTTWGHVKALAEGDTVH